MTSSSRSASSRSPRAVEPVTSANRTVASLRSWPGEKASETGAPQDGQKRLPSGSDDPQREHAAGRATPQFAQNSASLAFETPQEGQARTSAVYERLIASYESLIEVRAAERRSARPARSRSGRNRRKHLPVRLAR